MAGRHVDKFQRNGKRRRRACRTSVAGPSALASQIILAGWVGRLVCFRSDLNFPHPDGAAELMGVKPTTLLARMKKWGLKKPASQ